MSNIVHDICMLLKERILKNMDHGIDKIWIQIKIEDNVQLASVIGCSVEYTDILLLYSGIRRHKGGLVINDISNHIGLETEHHQFAIKGGAWERWIRFKKPIKESRGVVYAPSSYEQAKYASLPYDDIQTEISNVFYKAIRRNGTLQLSETIMDFDTDLEIDNDIYEDVTDNNCKFIYNI